MFQLNTINLYPGKRIKPVPCEETRILSGGGLEGDFRQNADKRHISITDQVLLNWMASQTSPGLCFQKFSANLVFDRIDFDRIRAGSVLNLGDASIQIEKVGKHCFGDECIYCQQGIDCILIRGVLFGCGKDEGMIKKGMQAEVEE